MKSPDSVSATAGDGTVIPLTWFDAKHPRCSLVFLPALGIQSKLYSRLGAALAERDVSVCLVEQRGHGASPVPVGRGTRFGIAELVEQDIPAVLEVAEARAPGLPLVLGGHSLGGHLSTLFAGIEPGRISGVAHVACGFPYYRDFPAHRARLIRILCFLVSLAGWVPGYFPGRTIGFAGRESIQLMRDWRGWALTGRFDYKGRKDAAELVSGFTGPVLSVSLDRDEFSSPAAVDRALSPFTQAVVEKVTLDESHQGEYLGHFAWTREPEGVAEKLAEWSQREVMA